MARLAPAQDREVAIATAALQVGAAVGAALGLVCGLSLPYCCCRSDSNASAEPAALAATAEFHKTFKSPVVAAPALPPPDRAKLRLSLLEEEVAELRAAVETDDLVECADALADIQYVLSGAVLEFGMGSCFKELFDEVHRSNMSKLCATAKEAEKTLRHYKQKDGSTGTYQAREGGYLVLRSDGKTLKSINYSPCELAPILKKAAAKR